MGYRGVSQSRLLGGIFQRPALKREDDPEFWDHHHADQAKRLAEARANEPINWPVSRQLALLMVRRGQLADEVSERLRAKGVNASQSDFATLRDDGLAVRPLAERYHRITAYGTRIADQLAAVLAKANGIHHITYVFNSYTEHKARCTCGWTQSGDRKMNRNWRAPLERAAEKHLADPQAWIRAMQASQKMIAAIEVIGAKP